MKRYISNRINASKDSTLTSEVDYEELKYDVMNKARRLMRQYPALSSDSAHIKAAKEIAKEAGVRYQDILKLLTPNNNISQDWSWDHNGKPFKTN